MDFDLYTLLLIVHIVTVVAGIGTVSLSGLYAAKAKAAGPSGGASIAQANFDASKVAEYFIYAIPVTGVLMMVVEDYWEWSQTWVWLSIVLYVAGLGISHGVMIPSSRRMIALLSSGPPNAESEAIDKRLAGGGAALNLLAVVIIVLMVWKPGV